MIASFKHKGLRALYLDQDRRKVPPDLVERIEMILGVLAVAEVLDDIHLPTLRLHPLKGDRKGYWAVTVRANWRITFRFEQGHALEVDFVDYH
jgi:proteic killer suppression protein